MASKEINEKVAPIVLHDSEEGKDYTLEFNRETIVWAEGRGFDISDVGKYPMSKLPELFYYAFRMHHKNVSREKTDKILFDYLGGMPDGMAERLGALWAAPYEALNAKGDAKNARITVEM